MAYGDGMVVCRNCLNQWKEGRIAEEEYVARKDELTKQEAVWNQYMFDRMFDRI